MSFLSLTGKKKIGHCITGLMAIRLLQNLMKLRVFISPAVSGDDFLWRERAVLGTPHCCVYATQKKERRKEKEKRREKKKCLVSVRLWAAFPGPPICMGPTKSQQNEVSDILQVSPASTAAKENWAPWITVCDPWFHNRTQSNHDMCWDVGDRATQNNVHHVPKEHWVPNQLWVFYFCHNEGLTRTWTLITCERRANRWSNSAIVFCVLLRF